MQDLSLIKLKSRIKVRVVVQQSVSSFAATESSELWIGINCNVSIVKLKLQMNLGFLKHNLMQKLIYYLHCFKNWRNKFRISRDDSKRVMFNLFYELMEDLIWNQDLCWSVSEINSHLPWTIVTPEWHFILIREFDIFFNAKAWNELLWNGRNSIVVTA